MQSERPQGYRWLHGQWQRYPLWNYRERGQGWALMVIKIQRWCKEGRAPQRPATSRAPRALCSTLWKTTGPASLSLHRLWLEHSNESSWDKPPANWFLLKNNIFLTQAPPSRGILVNKKDTPRESRNQQASPTTRQALSCGENSHVTQWIGRGLLLKTLCRWSSLKLGASLNLNQPWSQAPSLMSSQQ